MSELTIDDIIFLKYYNKIKNLRDILKYKDLKNKVFDYLFSIYNVKSQLLSIGERKEIERIRKNKDSNSYFSGIDQVTSILCKFTVFGESISYYEHNEFYSYLCNISSNEPYSKKEDLNRKYELLSIQILNKILDNFGYSNIKNIDEFKDYIRFINKDKIENIINYDFFKVIIDNFDVTETNLKSYILASLIRFDHDRIYNQIKIVLFDSDIINLIKLYRFSFLGNTSLFSNINFIYDDKYIYDIFTNKDEEEIKYMREKFTYIIYYIQDNYDRIRLSEKYQRLINMIENTERREKLVFDERLKYGSAKEFIEYIDPKKNNILRVIVFFLFSVSLICLIIVMTLAFFRITSFMIVTISLIIFIIFFLSILYFLNFLLVLLLLIVLNMILIALLFLTERIQFKYYWLSLGLGIIILVVIFPYFIYLSF